MGGDGNGGRVGESFGVGDMATEAKMTPPKVIFFLGQSLKYSLIYNVRSGPLMFCIYHTLLVLFQVCSNNGTCA